MEVEGEGDGSGGMVPDSEETTSSFMTQWFPVAPTDMEPLDDPIAEEPFFLDDDDMYIRSTPAASRSMISGPRMKEIIPEQFVKKSVEKKSKSLRDTLKRMKIEEIQSDLTAMEQEQMQKRKLLDAEQRRDAFLESREKSVVRRRKTAKKVPKDGTKSPPLGQWASSSPTSPTRHGRGPTKDVSPDDVDRWVRNSPTRHTIELQEYCEFLRAEERKVSKKKTPKKTGKSENGNSLPPFLIVEDVEQSDEQGRVEDESIQSGFEEDRQHANDVCLFPFPL
jgi:hypothetical protein